MNDTVTAATTLTAAQDPGDYAWRALSALEPAHAFPPVPEGRLPGRSACDQVRWSVAAGHRGTGHCFACVAELRDRLRAINVALAAAGIRTDRLDAYERRPGLVDYDAPEGAGESVEASRG